MPRKTLSKTRALPACPRARSPGASSTRRAPSTTCSRTSTTWCCTSRPACSTRSTSACRLGAGGRQPERPRRAAGAGLSRLHPREAAAVEPAVRAPHARRRASFPSWYQQKLEGLMGRVEEAMAPLFPPGREARPPARRARAVGGRARHHLAVDRRQAVGGDDGDRQPPGRGPGRYLPRRPCRRRPRAGGQGGLTDLAPRLPYRATYHSSRDRMCFWTVVACGAPG